MGFQKITADEVVEAIQAAESGVDYSPKYGALCPCCGKKTRVTHTKAWAGQSRIRYHRCDNGTCHLHTKEQSIKSVESLGGKNGK